MYPVILGIHNILRWIVLIVGIVATVLAYLGWLGRRPWTPESRRFGSFFAISLDIQLLFGLLLYFVLSPITRTAMSDFGAAMGVADLRFFALEHSFYMLLAVVFAHLGSVLARRGATDEQKYRRMALFFTLAMLLIFLGIPWMRPLLPSF
jgi:hypothetical protein